MIRCTKASLFRRWNATKSTRRFCGIKLNLKPLKPHWRKPNRRSPKAGARVTEAQANSAYMASLAGETIIRAPFSGVIGQKFVDTGDYVMPGEKLLTLVDNGPMHAVFQVPERLGSKLHTGLAVTIHMPGMHEPLQARVTFVSPVVDADSLTIAVKARIHVTGGTPLRDGQSVDVALSTQTNPRAIVLPEGRLDARGRAVSGLYGR